MMSVIVAHDTIEEAEAANIRSAVFFLLSFYFRFFCLKK